MVETNPDVIDIWLTDERQVMDIALLDRYRQLLNDQETGRHQRFIFSLHRHQFLVARALVRTVLAGYLGEPDPSTLAFTSNEHGKPELMRDAGLQFNLSHTNGLIALAVTRDRPVGIDVEHLSRQADIAKLADRYFSLAESRALLDLPVAEWNERFYDLWTLKEAYLKACGTGLRTPLHAFSFHLGDATIAIGFGDELKDDPASWRFWQLDVANGAHRLSVALHAPGGGNYRLRVRQGMPFVGFEDITPVIIRRSDGAD